MNEFSGFCKPRQSTPSESNAPTDSSWASSTVMNMMKKMGWKHGKGLGKESQGIVEPVEVILRLDRGSVSAYGNETEGLNFEESAKEARCNVWNKFHAGKVKPEYKTLDEIVEEENEMDQSEFVRKSNFIDVTSSTQKVYDSFQSFQQEVVIEQQSKRQNFDVPNLIENIDFLISMCRNENFLNNNHLQNLKNKTSCIEYKKVQMQQYIEDANKNLNKIKEVLELVKRFENPKSTDLDVLDEFYELFCLIKNDYHAEYRNFDLDAIIEFKVLPLIKQLFSFWNPLDSNIIEYGFEQMRKWHSLFDNSDKSNVYDLMMHSAWMPVVQRAISTRWDPKTESLQMIDLISIWSLILPAWIQDTLLDNVMQKISAKVDEWDPVNDPIPIDSWIIPWHELLGKRLDIVYSNIRLKLSRVLRKWQATDSTALSTLKPWKKLFSHSTMQTFLKMNIVPKLGEALRQMDLNPTINLEYKEFFALLEWQDLMGQELVVEILVNNFFQRWYEYLCEWLTFPDSLSDVSSYYKKWKERVPSDLIQTEAIKSEFIRAITAIKQAREGTEIELMVSFSEFQTQVYSP